MSRFLNQVIWITGASSGIGAAVAKRLAEEGATVVLSARRVEPLQQLVADIEKLGGRAHSYPIDIRNRAEVLALGQRIENEVGPIDVLVANAGTHLPTDILKFNSTEYAEIMEINYFGALYAVEAVLPFMLSRKSGYLVGVASVAGFRGLPLSGAYCASKAALIAFFESLDFDLFGRGVAVSIVTPGFVKTPLTDKNNFPMPFLMEVDSAAQVFVNGMAKRKRLIHFPWQFSSLLMLLRVLPYRLYSFIIRKTVVQ